MNGRGFLCLWAVCLLMTSCQKPTGSVCINFSTSVDGHTLQLDTFLYQNASGNQYSVSEVQYFISDVVLTRDDGTEVPILSDSGAHYVDLDIQATLCWKPSDEIPAGHYTSISFVFGLSPRLNHNYFYTNAPENNMAWPGMLGGGYHYMKINGKWKNVEGVEMPFNLHTGRSAVQDGGSDFEDNSFLVTLPLSGFNIGRNETRTIGLNMNVNNWFVNPNLFDFNVFGGSIMQNANAQRILKENGADVFSVLNIDK